MAKKQKDETLEFFKELYKLSREALIATADTEEKKEKIRQAFPENIKRKRKKN